MGMFVSLMPGLSNLYKHKKLTLLTIAMMTISGIVLFFAIGIYCISRNSEWSSRKVINKNFDYVYHIELMNLMYDIDSEKAFCKFYSWMQEQPEVECCGVYSIEEEPKKIIYVSDGILELFNIETDKDNWTDYNVLVGDNLKNEYKVGDKFFDEQYEKECRVVGYLPEKSLFPKESFLNYSDALICLDDYIVVNYSDVVKNKFFDLYVAAINNFFYVLRDGTDADAFTVRMIEEGKKYDLDLYGIHSLNEVFKIQRIKTFEKAGQQYLMPIVLMLCAIMAIIITNSITLSMNLHDIGIFLSCGLTKRNVVCMYAFENLVKIFISYVIMLLYLIYYITRINIDYKNIFYMALPIHFIAMIFIYFICIIPAYCRIKSKKIIDLVKGLNND